MKNITTFCLILLMSFSAFGQFNYNVTTSSKEIEFETINAPDGKQYDAISFSKTRYYGEPGQPRMPMKQMRYVLPENAEITDLEINKGTATLKPNGKPNSATRAEMPPTIFSAAATHLLCCRAAA
jgi:hypothetical protein